MPNRKPHPLGWVSGLMVLSAMVGGLLLVAGAIVLVNRGHDDPLEPGLILLSGGAVAAIGSIALAQVIGTLIRIETKIDEGSATIGTEEADPLRDEDLPPVTLEERRRMRKRAETLRSQLPPRVDGKR